MPRRACAMLSATIVRSWGSSALVAVPTRTLSSEGIATNNVPPEASASAISLPFGVKQIALPRNANVVDFAYAVHTDVGNSAVGCKINGKFAPLSSELQNGDEVEVLTSAAQQAPPSAWESLAVTGKARAAIRRATRTAMRDQYAGLGRRIVE
eukprot:gene14918-19745_t